MEQSYFHRVQKVTPTRFWINNPTLSEAEAAIGAGAEYCTTNPTYASKMLLHPEMKGMGMRLLRRIVDREENDSLAASRIQREMVQLIMPPFMKIHEKSGGTRGWVSIQGDPVKEDDPAEILRDAEAGLGLERNYIAKIPVTVSGLSAIATLAGEGVPIIATEVMSLSQAVHAAETYAQAIGSLKKAAPLFLTHITGIFDQRLGQWAEETGTVLSGEALRYAGFLAGRKQYRIIKERNYPVTLLGGGARSLHHFTDFVGADMHITINWKGTADRLIESDPPVENSIDRIISESIAEELLEKVPLFRQAWTEEGLGPEEFCDYPPVVLFRTMFLEGWEKLLKIVREARHGK